MVGEVEGLFSKEEGRSIGTLCVGNKDSEEKICPRKRFQPGVTKTGPTKGFYAREK
jgi:hypothetical protein